MGWGKIFTASIKKEVQSTFQAYKEEIQEASVDKAVERLGSQIGMNISYALTHPVSTLKSVGILSPYTASDVATQSYMSLVDFNWDQWWWTKNQPESGLAGRNDMPWGMALNRWGHYNEKEWGEYYYKNRAGGVAGRMIGDTAGNILGLFFPGLASIFKELFGEVGSFLGTNIYGLLNGSLGLAAGFGTDLAAIDYPNRPVGGDLAGGTTLSMGTPHNPTPPPPPPDPVRVAASSWNGRGLRISNLEKRMIMIGW